MEVGTFGFTHKGPQIGDHGEFSHELGAEFTARFCFTHASLLSCGR